MKYLNIVIFLFYFFNKNIFCNNIIADIKIENNIKINKILDDFINHYLKKTIGKNADSKTIDDIKVFFKSVYFIDNVKCEYEVINEKTLLKCNFLLKNKINKIITKGLPISLLEKELFTKIPIYIGQDIVIKEDSKKNIIQQINNKVKVFLESKGFYYSNIETKYVTNDKNRNIDILINISNGTFIKVNNVFIDGDIEDKKNIIKSYKRMCFSVTNILEGFLQGFNCYSEDLESQITKNLLEKLLSQGYVQANIRVSKIWLTQNKSINNGCSIKNTSFSRCIDLKIDIDKGPKISWDVLINGAFKNKTRSEIKQKISSFFFENALSRTSTPDIDYKNASDHLISSEELKKEASFINNKSIDEQELNNSVENMKLYLANKGYPNAQITYSYEQIDENNINIIFNVDPKLSFFIKKINIVPEYYNQFIDHEIMDKMLSKRSIFNSGAIVYNNIEDVKIELIKQLNNKGFNEVSIKEVIEGKFNYSSDISFFIKSDERQLVKKIKINNGNNKINNQLLPFLLNCELYNKNVDDSCTSSSFFEKNIDLDKKKIIDYYRVSGYFYVDAKSRIIKNNNLITIEYDLFDTRKNADYNETVIPQKIEDYVIIGNNSIANSVIERLIPKEINVKNIRKGVSNIKSSNGFSRVEHKFISAFNNSDEIYFLLNLTPKTSLTLDLALSFSTDKLFSIHSEVNESNLFYSMLKLNTSLNFGLFIGRQTSFSNQIIWPKIFGKPINMTLSAPVFVYDDFSLRPNPSTRLQNKASLSIDYTVNSIASTFIKYTFFHNQERFLNSSIIQTFADLDGLMPTLLTKGKNRGLLKTGLIINTVDNAINPRKGLFSEHWLESSGHYLFGDPPFFLLGTKNSFYVPIFSFLTLATQFTLSRSFIKPSSYNFNELKNSSFIDRLGGDKSIRGYAEGNIGLEETLLQTHNYSGYFLNTFNAELRFPLGPIESTKLYGALFFDQGLLMPITSLYSLFTDIKNTNIIAKKALGISFGASIRYLLPIGPISVDYGFSPLHNLSAFHLMVGYLF